MITKKLLAVSRFHQIPQIVRNCLQCPPNCTTQLNPPFLPKTPSILATNLIKSYFEHGLLKEARILFDEMSERDVVAWTSMITGYTYCDHHTHAWRMLLEMMREGIHPNAFTMSSTLKACKGMKSLSSGIVAHGLALKHGTDGNTYVDNALLDMYATCCVSMDDACLVFRNMYEKNAASWTTLITAYTHRGDGYGGLRVFKQMLLENGEQNSFTFSIAVNACTSTGLHTLGKQIHAAVIKHGCESNLPVMNSILDMYCRCDGLSEANQHFCEMTLRDLITWNTLIAGYERFNSSECFNVFSQMESEGFSPNCFTFTSLAAACANLAALIGGQQVHGAIIRRGLEDNLVMANSLIDMYAKCGSIVDSRKVFSELSERSLVSWTSMMIGYGNHGYGKVAVELFDEMVSMGIRPDRIVFIAVLGACSHAGLVDEGLRYFKMMGDYNIMPNQEIYGCVVDLLGRAGRVEEAYELIESMPFKPDETVWGALLGACKAHKLQNLGKLAAGTVLGLRPKMVGTYVMLSNIYAADGKWGEFAQVRKLMRGMGGKKKAGKSWIEVQNQVYSFVVGDKVGSHMKCVCEVVDMLVWHMKEVGYVPDLDCLIHGLEDGDLNGSQS